MLPKYRFKISINDVETVVTPLGWGSAKRVIEREAEEVFYRAKISEKFIFTRDDRDLIKAQDIETRFIFIIERSDDGGTTYSEYWRGFFNYTDCEFHDDVGNEKVLAQVQPIDSYENILAGLEKEFDLIQLAPEITSLTYVKQPVFQVYVLDFTTNPTFLTNYLNGVYWEQPTIDNNVNALTLVNDYKFAPLSSSQDSDFIPGSDASLNPDVSGSYDLNTKIRSDGQYQYRYNSGNQRYEIIDLFDSSNVVYQSAVTGVATQFKGFALQSPVMTSTVDGTSEIIYYQTLVYGRILCNVDTIGVTPTIALPNPDIVDQSEIYTKVLGEGDIGFIFWDGHQAEPTPFGKFADDSANHAGEYHTKPDSATYGQVFPLAPSLWTGFSAWVYFNANMEQIQEDASESIVMNNAYKLPDVISAILSAIDPNITHEESATYSDFFYGSSNSIRGIRKWPIIVPKSNVIIGEYDKPAQKAPIKFGELLDMLYQIYKIKWYIDENSRFILEHIDYFENGGLYGASLVSTDLTTLLEPKTGLNWEYGANSYTYDKAKIAERIEYSWMDNVGKAFEGSPMIMRSAFAEPGNVEKWEVTQFTSDVDFIQIQPGDISKQGFVLFECLDKGGGLYYVPFVDITLPDGIEYKIQNGYAAFAWLVPNYHNRRTPTPLITINEENVTAINTQRRRKQNIRFGRITEPNVMALVATGIGNGKAVTIEEDLNGGTFDIELEHDNE